MSERVSMAQAKANPVAGTEFVTPGGSVGVILEGKVSGKPQAELTCVFVKDGVTCTNRHVRLSSDWHQCSRCQDHSKAKGPRTGGSSLAEAAKSDPEIAAMLAQAEAIQAQIKAKQKAETERKRAEKKALAGPAKEERTKQRLAKQAREKLERALKLAAEKGIEVSPQTVAEAEEAAEALEA